MSLENFFPHGENVFIPSLERTVFYQDILQKISPMLTTARKKKLEEVAQQRIYSNTCVLDTIYDQGNISAVNRSLENMGFQTLHIIDSPRTKSMRNVAQGSEKWTEHYHYPNRLSCIQQLKDRGYKIVSTHLGEKSIELQDLPTHLPLAIVFGNEKDGVAQEILDHSDYNLKIPTVGLTQSFNISVAAAITFHHLFQAKKKLFKNEIHELTPTQAEILQAHWYLKNFSEDVIQNIFKN